MVNDERRFATKAETARAINNDTYISTLAKDEHMDLIRMHR